MEDKKYYYLAEIIIGLREEYQKNQKLLDELKKYVEVEHKKLDSFTLSADELDGVNSIMLHVQLRQSEIAKMLNYGFYRMGVCNIGEPYSFVGKTHDEDHYSFKQPIYGDYPSQEPEYKVHINNQKAFDEIVEEIYQTNIMVARPLYHCVNPFQSLRIDPHEISLTGNFAHVHKYLILPVLKYSPETDTIIANMDVRPGAPLARDFLDTPIRKDVIQDFLRDIIDENIKDYFHLHTNIGLQVNDNINGITELEIKKIDDIIRLNKKRNIKPWQ